MSIILKNSQIYEYSLNLKDFYNNCSDFYLPAKCNFYVYKNLNTLINAVADIDRIRQSIINKFGIEDKNKENSFFIPKEKQAFVQEELNDLGNLTQSLDIYLIPLEYFKDAELPVKYIKYLSFMITEEKKEE